LPDFQFAHLELEGDSGCRNFAHLQHSIGKAQIEHEAQTPQSGHQLTRELEALAGKISELG
jgi:hypothetical protein